MWVHPNLTRSISTTERRDEFINDCTEKENSSPLSFFTFSARKTPQTQKEKQATDLIWEKNQPMGQIFLTSLNLSYIISFLFSFFHQIFYRKAQSMPNIRGRNGTERGREDTNVLFLVLKYFTSPLYLFLSISPLLWSG